MKKSLLILPLVAGMIVCAGCVTKKSKKKSSGGEEDDPTAAIAWPSVTNGTGTQESPYNVTTAREMALKLEVCKDPSNQTSYIDPTRIYVAGYVCCIEDVAIERPDGKGGTYNDVRVWLADSQESHVSNEQVTAKDAKNGFCVYYALKNGGKWDDYNDAISIYGKLVTVAGNLINWMETPELTKDKSGNICDIVKIGEKASVASKSYTPMVTEEQSHQQQ